MLVLPHLTLYNVYDILQCQMCTISFTQRGIMVNLFMHSPQFVLPNDVQPRMWHTATASKLMPGWTQVTMFGGCPKWEWGKSLEALPSLAKTTVLEFSKQNTCVALHATGCHFLFPWFSAFSVFIHYLTFF